jgi:hypothetical protein
MSFMEVEPLGDESAFIPVERRDARMPRHLLIWLGEVDSSYAIVPSNCVRGTNEDAPLLHHKSLDMTKRARREHEKMHERQEG